MCGIVGFTGKQRALPLLLSGLKRVEYRGYDSAGVYLGDGSRTRSVGDIDALIETLKETSAYHNQSTYGIAHTRWATHGGVTEENAHPHTDCTGRIALVHNGIFENASALRAQLTERGHVLTSETDTEVLVHLVEEQYAATRSLEKAVESALGSARGAYGVLVMCLDEPGLLVAACDGSPLSIGILENERLVASDVSALAAYTTEVIHLEHKDIAVVTPQAHIIRRLNGARIERMRERIEVVDSDLDLGEHPHFMIKEIMQVPQALRACMAGRLDLARGLVRFGGLTDVEERLRECERVVLTGCGTAYNAAVLGGYYLEQHAGIPAEVVLASEFPYRLTPLHHAAVIAVSQSGETKDTLEALADAKRRGALTLGVVNKVGTRIPRVTDAGVYMRAGPEVAVASTKAFFAPVAILLMLSVHLGRMRGLSHARAVEILKELAGIPDVVERTLAPASRAHICRVAKVLARYDNALYLGRSISYPVACEGALKIKEVSYLHAEGYAAGEMKHGPLAMIDETFPSVIVVPHGSTREKTLVGLSEIRARKGPVFAIVSEGDEEAAAQADHAIFVPRVSEPLTPFVTTLVLHLLAYYAGLARDRNVDRPRNLAKAVTTE